MFFIIFFFFFRLKSRISITTKPTNMKISMYTHFFLACALSGYIFVNPFTSLVTDCFQHKQCIIMETETEANMKIWLCVQHVVIFLLTLLLFVLLIVICPSNTLL